MRISNEFDLGAPPDRCFTSLLDLPATAACIPGSRVGDRQDDGSYPVELTVKVGPMQFAYAGRATVVRRDETTNEAVVAADMTALRSPDKARITASLRVAAHEGGSKVHLTTELDLEGKAAHLGQAVIEQVAKRLIDRAAGCLAQRVHDDQTLAPQRTSLGRSPA